MVLEQNILASNKKLLSLYGFRLKGKYVEKGFQAHRVSVIPGFSHHRSTRFLPIAPRLPYS
jgi:hypothetical protein